jgi:L-serine dehydratase
VFQETGSVTTKGVGPNAGPISITDVFTIGIGPSSSHTVGPMRAARDFAAWVVADGRSVTKLCCELFGSLALTGKGHATDRAVILGLAGERPDGVDPDAVEPMLAQIAAERRILLGGAASVGFDPDVDIKFRKRQFLPGHPNGMKLRATLVDGAVLERTYYSVGGGAIRREGEEAAAGLSAGTNHPFASASEMLQRCDELGLDIAGLMLANERGWRDDTATLAFVDGIHDAMNACMDRGMAQDGILPGGLEVPRRARKLHQKLVARGPRVEPASVLEWVSLWALAVNEENAAGGRVVTAPTNGAAGVIPAVLRYYEYFVGNATEAGSRRLLLTAAAIGILYKRQASISAAEMGCQGEVGVACSMAAAGLAAALGGSNAQIENAAEIGMEHNLGLTCDPIGGLVQIPCIERNTMGAVKAINAAMLALHGDGTHKVSLDAVIETMRQTGLDMRSKYKETSLGGLAVNVVEC